MKPNGHFEPAASVALTTSLRTSGIVGRLSPEEFKVLILVLSWVTSSGDFVASAESLAPILGISTSQARSRLERLAEVEWNGKPILIARPTESGLRFFGPSPQILGLSHSLEISAHVTTPGAEQVASAVDPEDRIDNDTESPKGYRRAVIAHSRATYGRPREEVEREIEAFYARSGGQAAEESDAHRLLRGRLRTLGLGNDQIDGMFENFGLDSIDRQLRWLPSRHARNSAAYLIAALEGDYGPPPGFAGGPAGWDAIPRDGAGPGLERRQAQVEDEPLVPPRTHVPVLTADEPELDDLLG